MPGTTIPVPPTQPIGVENADYPPVIAQSSSNMPSIVPSSGQIDPSPESGLSWQRAGERVEAPTVAPPPPTPPVIRGQEPAPKEPSLEEVVRAACQKLATVAEVRRIGPGQLVIRVHAATAADARAAFAALSAVPQLVPYKIEFEANLGSR
jgi:hypothetical protein